MTPQLRITAASLLALAFAANTAEAAVVDLDLLALNSGTPIEAANPGYGSDGPVVLDWDPTNSFDSRLLLWNGGYSGRDAAYCSDGVGCALDLLVAAGFSITLDSFWLGAFPNSDRKISWSVIDLATNTTVASMVDALVSGATGRTNPIGSTSLTGFRIVFGPDGFNGGINDIAYSYRKVDDGPAPVPLPAGGALLLGGLAVLGALRRRA